MTDARLYRRWLDYLFDRPETEPAWFFTGEPLFDAEADPGFMLANISEVRSRPIDLFGSSAQERPRLHLLQLCFRCYLHDLPEGRCRREEGRRGWQHGDPVSRLLRAAMRSGSFPPRRTRSDAAERLLLHAMG